MKRLALIAVCVFFVVVATVTGCTRKGEQIWDTVTLVVPVPTPSVNPAVTHKSNAPRSPLPTP